MSPAAGANEKESNLARVLGSGASLINLDLEVTYSADGLA
jgi:hypothetical protein